MALLLIGVSLSQALRRGERFEKFLSREVACMHAVHITHLDTLPDRLSTDTAAEESLHSDD